MQFTVFSTSVIGCSNLYLSDVSQSRPTIDFASFFATNTFVLDILVFPTWTLTNMLSSRGNGRLLKSTYLSLPVISLTTTQCFPMILFNSSTTKIETGDPVSVFTWNLFTFVRPSIIKKLLQLLPLAKLLSHRPSRLLLPIRTSHSTVLSACSAFSSSLLFLFTSFRLQHFSRWPIWSQKSHL